MVATFAGQYGPEGIEYPDGGHASSAPVYVYESDGVTPATLFTDRTKTTIADNPFTADIYGNMTFWAEPGFYQVGVGGITIEALVYPDPLEAAGQVSSEGFTYVQSTPASTWTIPNTLGRYPRSVTMVVNGEVVDSDYDFPDINTIIVTNPYPVAGRLEVA